MNNKIRVSGIRSNTFKPIKNTRRVERVLKLIVFLNRFRSIKEIALHLDIHNKSVNRYLNLLTQMGFIVERGHKKYTYFRIKNTLEYFSKIVY